MSNYYCRYDTSTTRVHVYHNFYVLNLDWKINVSDTKINNNFDSDYNTSYYW